MTMLKSCKYNNAHLLATGAHLLCYPGAFNMTTGPLHWELLQRARYVSSESFAPSDELQGIHNELKCVLFVFMIMYFSIKLILPPSANKCTSRFCV
jgi:hypothetical protein